MNKKIVRLESFLTVRITNELKKKLKDISNEKNITMSKIINEILTKNIN